MEFIEFENLVKEAILSLPQTIRLKMENVAITIDNNPTQEQIKKTGTKRNNVLLGLYEGVPRAAWGKGFGGHLPDKITIFKDSIEKFEKTPEGIRELVKKVVWHEISHHFGFSEKEARKLEEKRG